MWGDGRAYSLRGLMDSTVLAQQVQLGDDSRWHKWLTSMVRNRRGATPVGAALIVLILDLSGSIRSFFRASSEKVL
jgi:hypothetical protein